MKLGMQDGGGFLSFEGLTGQPSPLVSEETNGLVVRRIDEQRTQEIRRLMSLKSAIKIRRNKNETPKR